MKNEQLVGIRNVLTGVEFYKNQSYTFVRYVFKQFWKTYVINLNYCLIFFHLDNNAFTNRSTISNSENSAERPNSDSSSRMRSSPGSSSEVQSFLNSVIKLRETLRILLLKEPIASFMAPIERETKIRRENLMFSLLFIFLVFYLLFGYHKDFVCNFIIGFFYPAYASIMSVEPNGMNNFQIWLIYWPIYALSLFFEHSMGYYLFYSPSVYCLIKCAFLIWVMFPGIQGGGHQLYQHFIRRFILAAENQLKKET